MAWIQKEARDIENELDFGIAEYLINNM